MREPELTIGDRRFVIKLMKTFNIKRLNIDYSSSTKKYPDIWCFSYEKPPRIVVTGEWEKQDADERRKRLVHEFLHFTGVEHDESKGYSTFPARDSYSKKVYRSLI